MMKCDIGDNRLLHLSFSDNRQHRRAGGEGSDVMDLYRKIYEFGASAGSFEGYLYRKKPEEVDMHALENWVGNLKTAYDRLPPEARNAFQASCDGTLGRAARSLMAVAGKDHPLVAQVIGMIQGTLPESPDAFDKTKWFHRSPQ